MIKKLLDSFVPENYKLNLTVDPDAMEFSGSVDIKGKLTTASTTVSLHAKGLTFSSTSINQTKTPFKLDSALDIVVLTNNRELDTEPIELRLEFSGVITDEMVGMYPCYFEHGGRRQKIIATQFESHHAREVFPCIDEPAAKATFDLTLVAPAEQPVLSNTPLKIQTTQAKQTTTTFETTPRMSTYLLAFVFGPIHSVETTTKTGVVVRSWASLAQPKESLNYSLTEAVNCIEFYNEYFNTPYPLSKCDQVALPDFDAGAMENWGLVTYRESALLTDPENRSITSEQYVSIVVAHELSHQWFGNLVTMQWWDDLWLNESFASLMEYIAIDALHPDWNIWEDYTASDAVMASNRDVYSDVQPVRVDVNDPAEITTLFDGAIVYAKGGRLLKMLREYIGEDEFKAGLHDYFKQHAYQNTSRDNLWQALETSSGKPIGKIMNSWLEQSGLPILQVDQTDKQLSLSQQRLLIDRPRKQDTQLWQIPLLSNSQLPIDLLTTKQTTIQLNSSTSVLFNNQASGHYVVNYQNPAQRLQLATGLQDLSLPPEARINSLNDALLLAKAGKSSLTDALNLVQSSNYEPRDSVWSQIGVITGQARSLIEGDLPAERNFKSFLYSLSALQHGQLGWLARSNEPVNTTQLRRTMAGLVVASEDKSILQTALAHFNARPPEKLDAEFRSLLMSVAVQNSPAEVVDTLLALHNKTHSSDLQADICSALCSTKSETVAQQLLGLLKDNEKVRTQDVIRWFAYLLRNKYSRPLAWQWMEDNWSWLTTTFASSKSYDAFPRYCANFLNSAIWLERYQKFFEPKLNDLALQRNITIGLKEIEARVAWRERDEAAIAKWLAKLSPDPQYKP